MQTKRNRVPRRKAVPRHRGIEDGPVLLRDAASEVGWVQNQLDIGVLAQTRAHLIGEVVAQACGLPTSGGWGGAARSGRLGPRRGSTGPAGPP